MKLIIDYLIIINILVFLTYAVDKRRAKTNKFRIHENKIYTLIFLGGSIGSLLAINVFNHKKRKKSFKIISWISLIIWLFIIFYIK